MTAPTPTPPVLSITLRGKSVTSPEAQAQLAHALLSAAQASTPRPERVLNFGAPA